MPNPEAELEELPKKEANIYNAVKRAEKPRVAVKSTKASPPGPETTTADTAELDRNIQVKTEIHTAADAAEPGDATQDQTCNTRDEERA